MIRSLLLASLLLGGTCLCSADTTTYHDAALFAAATTNLHTTNFDTLSGPVGYTYYGMQLIHDGITFDDYSSAQGGLFVVSSAMSSDYSVLGSSSVLTAQQASVNSLLLTFAGETAVAFTFNTYSPYAPQGPVQVTFSTGDSFLTEPGTAPGGSFLGLTSTTPITWVSFETTAYDLELGIVQRGNAGNVPEPVSALLLAGGLLSLLRIRKTR